MEYNHERFILNRLCEFSNRDVEADFMEYEKTASLNIVRFLMLLMGFVFAMFAFSDYYFYGSSSAFLVSLGLRGLALFIIIVVFSVIGTFSRYDHALLMVTLVELAVFAIYLLNIYINRGRNIIQEFMSVILFILVVFLIPNRWKNSIIAGCAIWAGYMIFCIALYNAGESSSLIQRGIYFGVCLIACAIFLFGREKSRRRQFVAEKLLEFMSITDRLTSIFNRGRFETVLNQWIKNMRHNPFCLLLFDIDDFKKVNDRYGHIVGDKVLVGITKIVSANIRDEDIFARWGGEEFVLLFGTTGLERARELAERLRMAVGTTAYSEAGIVTISIGVAEYQQGESLTDFVKRADEKMYEAKEAGKNRVSD